MKRITEQGRSMIEMLGVLAIIGVLSVGGIAGFSKAMERYRINKTIWQVNYIAGNIRTLFGSQKDYSDLMTSDDGNKNHNYAFLKKLHIMPEEMYDDSSLTGLSTPFGGRVQIWASSEYNETDQNGFVIEYLGIPQEACIALVTQDWQTEGLAAILVNSAGVKVSSVRGCSGSDHVACVGGSVTPVPMPVEKAITACDNKFRGEGYNGTNYIWWKFY